MARDLVAQVRAKMTCRHCKQRLVTNEGLAQQTGLALRTVVRFLNGERVSEATRESFRLWLEDVTP